MTNVNALGERIRCSQNQPLNIFRRGAGKQVPIEYQKLSLLPDNYFLGHVRQLFSWPRAAM